MDKPIELYSYSRIDAAQEAFFHALDDAAPKDVNNIRWLAVVEGTLGYELPMYAEWMNEVWEDEE